MHEFIELTTTTASPAEAQAIARVLVEQRLAACVQISAAIQSVYRWEGRICEATEYRCTVKSAAWLTDRITEVIGQHHSYDTPEIVVTSISHCSAAYGQWLQEQLVPVSD